ncbi:MULTISPECIES: APC family permease [Gluconobacter]|uniref:Amino acid transporter n=1 Tax=Gluconobacter frateurii NRIC 0228 TaxID=1307946 RepID=A0ABQ0QCG2_9PROT|nr:MULTISPECIES: APC family permease [Gluconobacter]GBR12944.1 amino acid transporter [Gluconobacter frateurii NRIC 0228]GLP89943.1 aspartate:proton symporter [Gluconobacter frateurii]
MPHEESGYFRQRLGLFDLTMIGFGSIFGSGWLFAAAHVADMAGPASILSWLIGGVAVLLIGLVYCELGAALPLAGSVVRYPEQAHGSTAAFLTGAMTTIAFSSLISIEIVAARQYADAWTGGLTRNANGDPTLAGWLVQFAVMVVLYAINRRGIGSFALINNIVTVFKFLVPTLVIVLLLAHLRMDNFSLHGFAPHGFQGVETAISAGGVVFAYLGLTPILSVAGEVRNPQRTIPIALMASIILAMLVYLLLQTAFIGALPSTLLATGWSGLSTRMALPFHDIAVQLGLGFLAILVVTDAILSPTGTGNIYMSSTARVIYAWSRSGTFFPVFQKVDTKRGVPDKALLLTFGLALFWTLPFPSWQALIGVVSSALMLSYAMAPPSAAALRRSQPKLSRPFRTPCFEILSPLAFAIASLIVLWTGWHTLSWLMPTLLALTAIFMTAAWRSLSRDDWKQNLRCSFWMPVYFLGLLVLSWLGPFEGTSHLGHGYDDIVTILFALLIHHWAAACGLRTLPSATHLPVRA